MFKIIHFSEKGTTAHVKEEAAYMMFMQYLEKSEDGEHCLSFHSVGFDFTLCSAALKVKEMMELPLFKIFYSFFLVPEAFHPWVLFHLQRSLTCLQFHEDYEIFKRILITAFLCHGGFGID